MHWHAQPTAYTLRLYAPGGTYAARDSFRAVAQVAAIGDGQAFVHGMLREGGGTLTLAEWRALGLALRALGFVAVLMERRGRIVSIDLARA